MIKINDSFSAKAYNRGWELHHMTPTVNPKAKSKFSVDVTYYATFRLLCNAVLDKSIAEVEELKEVVDAIDCAVSSIDKAIEKVINN